MRPSGAPWTRTLQQRVAPAEVLGRVSAAYRTVAFGANAVGGILGGVVAETVGLDAVFIFSGVLTLLMLIPFQRVITSEHVEDAAS